MGLIFRKSINLGPFRLNLGKSGLGYSVGRRGFRIGRSARGRGYTSVGLPGTGLRYQTSRGCCVPILVGAGLAGACGAVGALGAFCGGVAIAWEIHP